MYSFDERTADQDIFLQELLTKYLDSGINTGSYQSQTTLTFLILQTNTIFTDDEYMFMLNLDGNSAVERDLYKTVIESIQFNAELMYDTFGFDILLKLPLTNVKDISYRIALQFKEIFFAPTTVPLNDPESAGKHMDVVRFQSRFNEMWIVTSLVNRRYSELVKRQIYCDLQNSNRQQKIISNQQTTINK